MTVPTAPNPSTAQARVIADELVRGGVTDVVLAPGSRSAALAVAVVEEPRLRVHVEIDERSAGFCALGFARVRGTPAPVVTTSGTAVANLLPAVVEADAAGVPLLVISANRPPELRGTAANQTIDQTKLFGERARWFAELDVAENRPGAVRAWRSVVSRAVAESLGAAGPAGPVHLDVPFREPTVPASDDGRTAAAPFTEDLGGRPGGRPWTAVARAPRTLAEEHREALADRIGRTERGLIVVGETSARPEPIDDLARATGWPVVAEPLSGARRGDHVVAAAGYLAAHDGFAAAHRPDLVLRIGRAGLSRSVASFLGPDVPQVLVDPDGAWLDPERVTAELVVADPELLCAAVGAALPGAATTVWLDSWRAADGAAAAAVHEVLDGESAATEPGTARDVADAVPGGGTLVVASSMPVRDLDLTMRPRPGLRVIGNRGASGIDGFASTVLGAALANRAQAAATVALAGDLSLLHDAGGFLLRPEVELDATIVALDNDGGGIFSFLPQARHVDPATFERVFGTPHGRDLADLARLHRLPFERVESGDRLGDAVGESVAAGGVRLLEVRTDRAANRRLHRRMGEAARAAIGEVVASHLVRRRPRR